MSVRTLIRKPLFLLYAGGILLLLLGGWLWWCRLNTNPERVFWGMVEQSLATSAVTIQVERSNEATQLRQTLKYSFGVSNLAHIITNIRQADAVVRNEAVATPTADFMRYTSIQTSQKAADGTDIDFSKVVGVWTKSDEGMQEQFSGSIFGTTLPLGGMAVPIGSLNPEDRAALMNSIKRENIYQVAFDKVKKEEQNGRLVYVYDVSVQAVAYASILKEFAANLGLHDFDQLDPSAYEGQEPLKLQFTVDVRAQRLIKISIPEASYEQTYSAYDVPVKIELPKETITPEELRQRLGE